MAPYPPATPTITEQMPILVPVETANFTTILAPEALEILPFLWEPGEAPPENDWQVLEQVASSRGIRIMLWEGEPDPTTRRRLEGLGIKIAVFSPAMNAPAEGDFLSVMRGNAENLQRVGVGTD